MGNRSRYIAGATVAATAVAAARRRRLRSAAQALGEVVSSPLEAVAPAPVPPGEGHAPGHRHLSGADGAAVPSRVLRRRWRLHAGRVREPYVRD